MTAFVPGLELNRQFFTEIVRPLLATWFPGVAYSAGLVGYGSDALGYDTAISTDHEWGPRLLLFLGEQQYPTLYQAMSDVFRHELPVTFRGYPTNFSAPDTSAGRRQHSVRPRRRGGSHSSRDAGSRHRHGINITR